MKVSQSRKNSRLVFNKLNIKTKFINYKDKIININFNEEVNEQFNNNIGLINA